GPVWYFNPFAWQFLFFIGVALGSGPSKARYPLPKNRLLVYCALGGLALALFLKVGYAAWREPSLFEDAYAIVFQKANRRLAQLRYQFPLTDKPGLAPLRVVHFFLLAYLCWAVIPRSGAFWHGRLARPLILAGQNSLVVFSFGIVLTYVANALLATRP